LEVQSPISRIGILLSARTPDDFSDHYGFMGKYSIKFIFTTFGSHQSATEIIRMLLRENHVACGTMIAGAQSLYHWKGEIVEAADVLHLEQSVERLNDFHPYEVPEIVTVDPFIVSEPYSNWIRESLSRAE
jgi:periplasmic divalent cation tolerance protein